MALQNLGWHAWVKTIEEWQPVTLTRAIKGYPWIKKTGMLNGKPVLVPAGSHGYIVNDVAGGLLAFEIPGCDHLLYMWCKHPSDKVAGHVTLEVADAA